MNNQVKLESVLNDDCTTVTITLHDVPLPILARTLESLGHPSMVRQFVDQINERKALNLAQPGQPETRKILKVIP